MKTKLFLNLALKPTLWNIRRLTFKTMLQQRKNWLKNEHSLTKPKTDHLKQFIISTTKIITITTLLTITFLIIDPYLKPIYSWLGWEFLSERKYITLLTITTSIGALFIALYHASISAIASTIFAKIPDEIINILVKEKINNPNLKFITFLTFWGIILIAFQALGYQQSYIIIPLIITASAIAIICFIKLAQQAFYLLNLRKLSSHIFQDFSKSLNLVTAKNSHYQDPTFQSYAHKTAGENLNTLESLTKFATKERHLKGQPFLTLSKEILSFLHKYEKHKQKIPNNSLWYKRNKIHPDWYKVDKHSLESHIRTGTFIKPNEVNDKEWVEKKCLPIVMHSLKINASNENYAGITQIDRVITAYTNRLASLGYADKGLDFSNDLLNIMLDSSVNREDNLDLPVIQSFAELPINMLLSYTESLPDFSRENIEKLTSSMDWSNDKSIYQKNFSRQTLEKLEWLSHRIGFELSIEGKVITPSWYITEIICEAEIRKFILNIETFVNQGGDFYSANIEKAFNTEDYISASAIASLAIEYWSKVDNSLSDWRKSWTELRNENRISNSDFGTIDFSFDKLVESVEKRKSALLLQVAKLTFALRASKHDSIYPDYKGQFLHYLADNLLNFLISNDKKLFGKIFPIFFDGCLRKFVEILPSNISLTNRQSKQELKDSMVPLFDLMEISGYARLMNDYYGDDSLWQFVESSWNDYIEDSANEQKNALLSLVMSFYAEPWEDLGYFPLHFNWKMRIYQEIQNIERHNVPDSRSDLIKHESSLVRIFADESWSSSHSGDDIFHHFYLRNVGSVGVPDQPINSVRLGSQLVANESEYRRHIDIVVGVEKRDD